MRYFAVRKNILDDLTFEVKRPRFEEGDAVVVFAGRGAAIEFIAVCVVAAVKSRRNEESPDVITLSDFVPLEPSRRLDYFAGSLRRVWHYLHPWKNFRRGVVRLENDDFWSIVNFEIDPHRSLFRCLLASMPEMLQTDFSRQYQRKITFGRQHRIRNYGVANEALELFFTSRVAKPFSIVPDFLNEFRGLEEMQIEGLPELGELNLSSDGENVIQLGKLTEDTQNILSENRLFTESRNTPRLLVAARELLSQPLERPRPHNLHGPFPETVNFVNRRWKDSIF